AEDHANAHLLAEGFNRLPIFTIDMSRVETNIILVDVVSDVSVETILEKMQKVSVLAVQFGPKTIRFVTHLDVSRADCEEALSRVEGALVS
ncbi:MAG: hypothetical protein DRP45_06945, partial [Candidatus Zixiibacteriota bacterium]